MDRNTRPISNQMQSQEQSQYPLPPQINGPGAAVGASPAQEQGPGSANAMQETWSQYPPPPSMSATSSSQQLYPQQPTTFAPPPGQDYQSMMPTVDQPIYAGFVPELGMPVSWDTDSLFALGSILEDGLFDFPMDLNTHSFQ
jgi:hypothetical protein